MHACMREEAMPMYIFALYFMFLFCNKCQSQAKIEFHLNILNHRSNI